MLFAIVFIAFTAVLITIGMRAKNRVFQSIIDSDLNEELGEELLPEMQRDGKDMTQLIGYGEIDLRNIVLGGSELSEADVERLWLGYHWLIDFKCQLCEKVLPEFPEPCAPRTKEPPKLPEDECDYCLGDGCEECGPIGR